MILIKLFCEFFKISFFAFGGGLSILPLMFETISDFAFISGGEFADLVAISQVTPGPMVVNAATYVGMLSAGISGGLIATLGVAIPSFVSVIAVMKFFDKFRDNQKFQGFMEGIRPATCGMIAAGLFTLLETVVFNEKFFSIKFWMSITDNINIFPLILFLLTILLVQKFELSPISAIIIMGLLGLAKVWFSFNIF